MKKTILYLVITLLCGIAVIYLFMAFFSVSCNPAQWSEGSRFIAVTMFFIWMLFMLLAFPLIKDLYDND